MLALPAAVLDADLVVSMPKLKTHHWAGMTASMKNLFGLMPGSFYGWPKNLLHWAGINGCIVDITATVRPQFAIVDGILAYQRSLPRSVMLAFQVGEPFRICRALTSMVFSESAFGNRAQVLRLLEAARRQGCRTISGTDMFLNQAVAQFELWTGKTAPRGVMCGIIERKLAM